MKLIPLKNRRFLERLDKFAESFYKRPHTFKRQPRPDVSFSTLNSYKSDASFVGYPREHNYTDYAAPAYAGVHDVKQTRWEDMRHFLLVAFKAGIPNADHPEWYYDTMCIQPPEVGFTGWHNNKNKPHYSLRFIHNSGRGYSIERKGNKQIKFKDQHTVSTGQKDWTCLYSYYPADGSVWFADRNMGDKPRLVVDIAIPVRYQKKAEAAVGFISTSP